ncbi:MAG: GDSL-type esterase/lipase family protein [Actinomycetota bacterium]|nr:GDSL-type esterase/lipase family protein [Actinomycetota bacterium]
MTNRLWNVAKRPLAVGGVLTAQMAQTIQRPDLESFTDQDPSGVFGDSDMPPLRMVVLGDSTVTAPGVKPLDACWARRTALFFSNQYRVDLISVAVGGAKVADVRNEQTHRAIVTGGDIAVVCVGGNDALRGTPINRFESTYDDMLQTLGTAFPAVAVCGVGDLGTIPRLPAMARGVARVRARAVDHAIGRVAHRYDVPKSRAWGAEFEPFETDPGVWAGDLFHASAEGHAMYADAAIPLVEEALRRSSPALPGSGESSP